MKVTRADGPGQSMEPCLRLLDRMAARRNSLPRPSPYAVRTVRIPMHDDVGLGATRCTPNQSFRYDPPEPTPTVGGPALSANGYVGDSALAERADVLTWTGPPLNADLTVMGVPRVELTHATERPDADLFVRIGDVDAAGRSRNVTERYVRVSAPAQGPPAPRLLELRGTAHTFRAGHRIRVVVVAGGSFPAYARNAGTGENPVTAGALRPNRHTVRLAGAPRAPGSRSSGREPAGSPSTL